MKLLVDGHNLIGQLTDLRLDDPDDEAKLVQLLRRHSTKKRGSMIVVVFDRGVYGHPQYLDGYGITCHFARSPQDADQQIIKRLRTLAKPKEWTLVSADRAIARVAAEYGVKVIDSRVFAKSLQTPKQTPAIPTDVRDRRLTPSEIEEWLRVFGETDQPDDDPASTTTPDRRGS